MGFNSAFNGLMLQKDKSFLVAEWFPLISYKREVILYFVSSISVADVLIVTLVWQLRPLRDSPPLLTGRLPVGPDPFPVELCSR
jgi:hypothetical protein